MSDTHIPVLPRHVAEHLAPQPGGTVVDCTVGLGGHALDLARQLERGRMVINDFDPANLQTSEAKLRDQAPQIDILPIRGNFVDVPRQLRNHAVKADVLLADLGFASNQMDTAERGFSFMREGPLDMRLDPDAPRTAADLVNTLPEAELVDILRQYGEEPQARRIAKKLVAERENAPILTTTTFASVVSSVVGTRSKSRIHPATRAFQALRIAVNDEITNLTSLLESISRSAEAVPTGSSAAWLNPGARIGIITFHSLEDRLVKRHFRELAQRELASLITRRPIVADEEEIQHNPRSRSAKLRVLRISDPPNRNA